MRRAVALTALLSWLGHGRVAVAKSCTPTINCTTEGAKCGTMVDDCGNTLSCSNCAAGQVCSNNSCVTCTKITSCTGKCGQISDGCGGVLDCGTTSCTGTKTECGPDNTCIVPGTAGDSMSQTFAAGALVIPMDDCNNPDNPKVTATYNNGTGCATNPNGTPACYATYSTGNVRHPFGLIYLLAVNNIPVNVILKPDKLSMDDADFTVTPPTTGLGSSPPATATYLSWSTNKYVTGTGFSPSQNPVQYGGMPFVVDATYADQALSVITAFNHAHSSEFSDVPLHIVNYSFTAPVYAQLASRPKPVGISGSPLTTFFTESGITDVVGSNTAYVTISGSGASWSYTWPTALGTNSNTACTTSGNVSTCSSLVGSVTANGVTNANARVLDVIWSADGTMNNWSAMPAFYQQGGNALVVAAASTWEYAAGGALNGGLSVGRPARRRSCAIRARARPTATGTRPS